MARNKLQLPQGIKAAPNSSGHYAFIVGHTANKTGQKELSAIPNDLSGMTTQLSMLGYTPVCGSSGWLNPSAQDFQTAWNFFAANYLKGAKVVVFYFSGHGGEVEGLTYLLMHDNSATETATKAHLVNWNNNVLGEAASKAENMTFVSILDCCRGSIVKHLITTGLQLDSLRRLVERLIGHGRVDPNNDNGKLTNDMVARASMDPASPSPGLPPRNYYVEKPNVFDLTFKDVMEHNKEATKKLMDGLLHDRSNQFVFWCASAPGQNAQADDQMSPFTRYVVEVFKEELPNGKEERHISWMQAEVQKRLIRAKCQQSSSIELLVYEQFFLNLQASKKHAVRRTYKYKAELEDEYNVQVAPIMDRLRNAKARYPDLYPEVFFAAGDFVKLAIEADMRALWAFWRRVQECVKLNTIDADTFFTGNWLGRAREYRELGEPLDIVNWYARNKHIPTEKEAAKFAEGRHYFQLKDIGKVFDKELVDNRFRPGRFLMIQQQEVIHATSETVEKPPEGSSGQLQSAHEGRMPSGVKVALEKPLRSSEVCRQSEIQRPGKGGDHSSGVTGASSHEEQVKDDDLKDQGGSVRYSKEVVKTSLTKVKELGKALCPAMNEQVPWLQKDGTISQQLQDYLRTKWTQHDPVAAASKELKSLLGEVEYDLSFGKPTPTGSLAELDRAMQRLMTIVDHIQSRPQAPAIVTDAEDEDERVRRSLQQQFVALTAAFDAMGLGAPSRWCWGIRSLLGCGQRFQTG